MVGTLSANGWGRHVDRDALAEAIPLFLPAIPFGFVLGLAITIVTAIGGYVTTWVASGAQNPFSGIVHKVEIVKMPVVEAGPVTPAKILVDPSILTDEQKKKLKDLPQPPGGK